MGATISQLWTPKLITVGFVGLQSSGKTSIAYKLLGNQDPPPPRRSPAEIPLHSIFQGNQGFDFCEFSADDKIRCLWRRVLYGYDAIVFVIDCADRESLPEAKWEFLNTLVKDPYIDTHPLLVFANKQDSPKAMDVTELAEYLEVKGNVRKIRPFHIQACSAITGEGLAEGLEWIRQAARANPIQHRPSGAW